MRVDVETGRNLRNERNFKRMTARNGLKRDVRLRLQHAGRGRIRLILRDCDCSQRNDRERCERGAVL